MRVGNVVSKTVEAVLLREKLVRDRLCARGMNIKSLSVGIRF